MRRNKRPTCIIQRFQHMFISASHSTLHVSSLVWELIFSVVPSFEPIHWALHFTDFSSFFKFITFLKTESSEVFSPIMFCSCHMVTFQMFLQPWVEHMLSVIWGNILFISAQGSTFQLKISLWKSLPNWFQWEKKWRRLKFHLQFDNIWKTFVNHEG